jgi:hypothetical protein
VCGQPPIETPVSHLGRVRAAWDGTGAMDETFMNYVECDLADGVELVVWARSRRVAPRRRRFGALRLRFA